jgi:hypothetical protein
VTLLASVTTVLTSRGVPHALIGAAALASAGVARSTFDLDLLTTDRRVLDAAFWTSPELADVWLDARLGDADDPLAGVVRLERTGDRPVDVIVGRNHWEALVVDRAEPMEGGPPVVRPSDLILLKLYAGGTQDLWDVRELLALPGSGAVAREVESALPGLPRFMREHWERARLP